MNEAYWGWYKFIGNNTNGETIGYDGENKIGIRSWNTQDPESLMHLSRELDYDKLNDQALNSLRNFEFLYF